MKDALKLCGAVLHLGHHINPIKPKALKEFKIKENAKRRRKSCRPADFRGQVYVTGLAGASFGATISYHPKPGSDHPDTALCEVYVDTRKVDQWLFCPQGKSKFILESKLSHQGLQRLCFSQAPPEDSENQNPSQPSCSGTVEIIFWRVMKLDRDERSDDESNDWVPDEGLPAIAVLTFHYRDEFFLRSHGLGSEKVQPDETRIGTAKEIESKQIDHLEPRAKIMASAHLNRKRIVVHFFRDSSSLVFQDACISIDRDSGYDVMARSIQQLLLNTIEGISAQNDPKVVVECRDGCIRNLDAFKEACDITLIQSLSVYFE